MDEDNSTYEEILLSLYYELENPTVLSTMLVEQISQSLFWIKRHNKDKNRVMHEALKRALGNGSGQRASKELIARFDTAIVEGVHSDEYDSFIQDLLQETGNTLSYYQAESVTYALGRMRSIDDLLNRQIQNLRHLQKSVDAVDFKKRLLKKMDIELKKLESEVGSLAIESR